MLRTIRATIDEKGEVRLIEPVSLPSARHALVTILEDAPLIDEVTLMSEAALAEDWNRPEEEAAWAHLQRDK